MYLFGVLENNITSVEFVQNKVIYISFITELELLANPKLSAEDIILVKKLLEYCIIIPYNEFIKDKTIEIRKKYKLKLPDAIIAASALFIKMPFATFDDDFLNIKKLNVIQLM